MIERSCHSCAGASVRPERKRRPRVFDARPLRGLAARSIQDRAHIEAYHTRNLFSRQSKLGTHSHRLAVNFVLVVTRKLAERGNLCRLLVIFKLAN